MKKMSREGDSLDRHVLLDRKREHVDHTRHVVFGHQLSPDHGVVVRAVDDAQVTGSGRLRS